MNKEPIEELIVAYNEAIREKREREKNTARGLVRSVCEKYLENDLWDRFPLRELTKLTAETMFLKNIHNSDTLVIRWALLRYHDNEIPESEPIPTSHEMWVLWHNKFKLRLS